MKSKILITLEYHKLLALTDADVQSWLEQRLDGKVSALSVLEATSQNSPKGTMLMYLLFEVTAPRTINSELMKGWLTGLPSYFLVRKVELLIN